MSVKVLNIKTQNSIFHTQVNQEKRIHIKMTMFLQTQIKSVRFLCRDNAMAASKINSINTTIPPYDPISDPDAR